MPASPRASSAASAGPAKRHPFEYAIVRVVPRVERGEGFNAGIVLHSRAGRFLGAKTRLDEALLVAISPDCDAETDPRPPRDHRAHRRGRPDREAHRRALGAGAPMNWLAAPSSTVIQPSRRTPACPRTRSDARHLFRTLVARPAPPGDRTGR
ncbi:MAG: DUF3037 domain-containing protein [Chloroflexota bacterium]